MSRRTLLGFGKKKRKNWNDYDERWSDHAGFVKKFVKENLISYHGFKC
jgi:hypothetical protein